LATWAQDYLEKSTALTREKKLPNLDQVHSSSLGAAFKQRLSRLAPSAIHCSCVAALPWPTTSLLIQTLFLTHRLACPWIHLIVVMLPTKCWTVS